VLAMLLVGAVASVLTLPATADEPEKWVALFNGKDLTGWKSHPKNPGDWKVEDGILVGRGPVSHLFSERGDYENFRYKIVAMINDKGNSGQYFRTEFGPGFPKGFEAQINSTHGDPVRTGSLYGFKDCLIKEMLVKPDTWFTQEVIAKGDHIIIKVDGKETVNKKFDEGKVPFKKGHFAIQQHDPGTVIKVKSIEVIELPSSK
jgi:hypothetical protein